MSRHAVVWLVASQCVSSASGNSSQSVSNTDLARKLAELEAKYDAQFKAVFEAIGELMTPPAAPRREIGFHVKPNDEAWNRT